MAIKIMSTESIVSTGIKVLVYGAAGVGKTTLIKTLPNPIILSSEGGLLPLIDAKLPYIEVHTLAEMREAYTWLAQSEDAKQYESIALDSISELAEVVLAEAKSQTKDPRKAYGTMQDIMIPLMRNFRDLPKHVYFSAKCERQQDGDGQLLYSPSMPGQKLGQQLPYYFDEVLAMRVIQQDKEAAPQRLLQCATDGAYIAKDRSGKLAMWEPADLTEIINKTIREERS